jgi:hypothetical protein
VIILVEQLPFPGRDKGLFIHLISFVPYDYFSGAAALLWPRQRVLYSFN